jgi:N-acetylglutamate synthase-like GNAT family acetyltransferase
MIKKFDKIFDLMKTSFPENEYRTYENQKKLLDKKEYKIITKEDEKGETIAFLSLWSALEFDFIEHFAVSPMCRGGGVGSEMMKNLMQNTNKPIILEIEIPHDEMSIKRLHFYERLGFKLNEHEYYQLPLRKNAKPLKMNLMSYPEKLSRERFESVKKYIHGEIYDPSGRQN